MRKELTAASGLPLGRVRSMEEVIAESTARASLNLVLMGVFAGIALVLAATGIYCMMVYSVEQRTREIGIRLAVGASHYGARGLTLSIPFGPDSRACDNLPGVKQFFFAMILAATCLMADPRVPRGFRPIFNGKDLTGWHISQVNHHGNTKAWTVKDEVLMVTQDPPGNGGILLTDKRYRDFEVSLEINPDYGCDGGLFLRSSEKGQGYQVMLDYLENGNIGGIYGEGLKGITNETGTGQRVNPDWQKHWKKDAWNHVRARIEGETPHIQVWLNGTKIVDWTDSENHLADGATDGMIAVQAHRSSEKNPRWKAGGYHRFRNIGVKELETKR